MRRRDRPTTGPEAPAELGTYRPLLHQKVPGNLWVSPHEGTETAVYEDDTFAVVDMSFERGGEGAAITQFDADTGRRVEQANRPAGYRAGYRFWIPKSGSGWFGAQSLWVENTDDDESIFAKKPPSESKR